MELFPDGRLRRLQSRCQVLCLLEKELDRDTDYKAKLYGKKKERIGTTKERVVDSGQVAEKH
jgi:hypothetical protein